MKYESADLPGDSAVVVQAANRQVGFFMRLAELSGSVLSEDDAERTGKLTKLAEKYAIKALEHCYDKTDENLEIVHMLSIMVGTIALNASVAFNHLEFACMLDGGEGDV